MSLIKKKTLIVGLGVSGLSAARHLMVARVPFDVADKNAGHVRSSLQSISESISESVSKMSVAEHASASHSDESGSVVKDDLVSKVIEDEWTSELFLRYELSLIHI